MAFYSYLSMDCSNAYKSNPDLESQSSHAKRLRNQDIQHSNAQFCAPLSHIRIESLT